jgi:hypothetical protein
MKKAKPQIRGMANKKRFLEVEKSKKHHRHAIKRGGPW